MQKIQTEKSDPWKGHPCIVAIVGFEPTGQSRKCRRSTARPCEFPLKCADAFDDRSSSHGFCVVVVICGLGYIKDASSGWAAGSWVATISLLSDLAVLVLLRPTHEPSALHWHCASHLAGRCITLWQLLAGGGTNLGMRSNTCLNSVQFVKYLNLLPSGLTHRDKENTRLAAILAKWPDQRKRNFMGVIAYILTHR